jgi:hypothetical protein
MAGDDGAGEEVAGGVQDRSEEGEEEEPRKKDLEAGSGEDDGATGGNQGTDAKDEPPSDGDDLDDGLFDI